MRLMWGPLRPPVSGSLGLKKRVVGDAGRTVRSLERETQRWGGAGGNAVNLRGRRAAAERDETWGSRRRCGGRGAGPQGLEG